MRRRIVIDLVLVEPPDGVFAGLGPREYPTRVAQHVLGLLAQLGDQGVAVEAFTIGSPAGGTRAPNPMVVDGCCLDPATGLYVDQETGELLPPVTRDELNARQDRQMNVRQ